MEEKIKYSVVIPFCNEEGAVGHLLEGITRVMDLEEGRYEIIAVDDGSTDNTRPIIEKMMSCNGSIALISFDTRKGQTAALSAGFDRAEGGTIISMDGDLQDDPSEIRPMLDDFRRSGVDVLCGWRYDRSDPGRKRACSKLGNFFQKLFFNTNIHDAGCTFRVYKADAVKSIKLSRAGLHRFLPVLLFRAGCTIKERKVSHSPRKSGASKYSLSKVPQTVGLFLMIIFGMIKQNRS